MRRLFSICVLIFCFVTLSFAITPVDNGAWITTGALLTARQDAAAIALPDGRVLVTGGRAADGAVLASSEIIQADGTAIAGPAMSAPRAGHTATLLPTGSVLIVGGDSGAGATVTAELFDPNTNVFTPMAATLNDARMGHVAALDAYGNVTIVGGTTANGPVLSIESFNITSQQFLNIGRMMYSRSQAALAAFADGRVLIAGGVDANGTILASTEIFDPNTGASITGPTMDVARAGASATLQDDGHIIVIGGATPTDSQGNTVEVASGELIAADGSNSFVATVLNVARAGHRAFLLPDNNGVLIVGGQALAADLNTAELYMPWTGTATLSTLATTHASAASAVKPGVMTVAGGKNQAGVEQFGFATLVTNQKDYAPGEPVIMGGSGWQPGEYVTLSMTQNPLVDGNITQQIQADVTGEIIGFDYAPTSADLNTAYVLTAVGSKSQAQVRFTDAFSSVSCSPSTLAVGAQTTCTASGSGNSENGSVVTWAVTTGTGTFSPSNTCTISGSTCSVTYTPSASGTQTIRGTISGTNRTTTLTVGAKVNPTVSWSTPPPSSAAYNSSFTVVATSNSTGAITYMTSGGCTNVAGLITMTSGTTACSVTANVAADTSYNAGSVGPTSVTATKVAPTVAWGTAPPTSAAYNSSFPVLATTNSAGAITYATSGGCSNAAGTVTMTSSTAACSVTANAAADTNYIAGAVGPTSVAATKATATVNTWPTASGITYGQALSTSTLTGGSGSVTGTFAFTSGATVPNAGTYHAAVTFTPTDTNYNTVSGTVDVAVAKAAPSVSAWPTASAITYGQALSASTLDGGAANVGGTFTFDSASTKPNAGTYAAAVTFTPTDTANYNVVSGSVNVPVNKATPTVNAWPTASGITYGQALSASLLTGGTASVPGTFAFTPDTTKPNAGTYHAAVTFSPTDANNYNTVAGSVDVAVAKATPTVSVWPTATGITYGQALSASTLSGGTASVAGTFAFTPDTTVPNAGTYQAAVTFTPTDTNNYNTVAGSVDVVVAKATPTVTAWPSASGITYGQALSASTLSAGIGSVPGTFTFTTDTTKPNAGTYHAPVMFTPTDTNNYNTVPGTVDVAVAKATPSVTAWPTASSITYGQALSASTLSDGTANVAGTFTFTPETTQPNAGTFAASVVFTPTDANNYNIVSGSVNVLVNKAIPSVIAWPSASGINYGQALSTSILTGGTGAVTGTFAFTPDATKPNAGTFHASVTFTPTDTNDYNTVIGNVDVVVAKTTPTVTAWPTASGITYGQALSASILSGGSANIEGVFAFSPNTAKPNAGTHAATVTFTPTDSDNYNSVSSAVDVAVAKATANVTAWPTASDITYGQALSASSLNGGTVDVTGTFNFTNSAVQPNAGTYAASVTFTPSDLANYDPVAGSVNVLVDKATPALIWAAPTAINYGTPLTATQLNASASVAGNYIYTPALNAVLSAGNQTLSVTFEPSDANYKSVTQSVQLVVNKVTPTITWAIPAAINYGTALTSAQLNAVASGTTGTLTYEPPLGTVPHGGLQTLKVTFVPTDATNYNTVESTVNLQVIKVPPTLTWATPASIAYGTALSATQLNASAGSLTGTFVYSPALGAVPATGIQTLSVTFTPDNSTDYASATASVLLTVMPSTGTAPVFSPAFGTFTSPQQIAILDSTPGVTIYYTTDGSIPTTSSNVYTGPVTVSKSTTLKAFAAGDGYEPSAVSTAWYIVASVEPTLSPSYGTYSSAQTVTIADVTPGVTIYYTTDGSSPTTNSKVYISPITVSSSTTIHAIAAGNGYAASTIASAVITIEATAPTFSPAYGAFTTAQSVTIADSTPGVSIYYTTDGSTPTTNSTLYTGPINVSASTNLKAIAAGNGYAPSSVSNATILIVAATPTLTPSFGTYTSPVSVSITDSTPGVTIYYTTDGSTPTTASSVYAGAITVSTTTTVKALAVGNGYTASAVGSASYVFLTTTPTFSPAFGTFSTPQSITIADATSGATIYYTTDGSTPTINSMVYTGPITVSSATTLKAIAAVNGTGPSAVANATYAFVASAPTFSPSFGTFTTPTPVTISDSTPGVTIYYTTDGSTPTADSQAYSGPLTVTNSITIKAVAVATGVSTSSVASASYVYVAPTPTFAPAFGTFKGSTNVTISDAASNVTIYYTTDGSTPTTNSNVYTGPITVSTSMRINAIAVGTGYRNSSVAGASYVIK